MKAFALNVLACAVALVIVVGVVLIFTKQEVENGTIVRKFTNPITD